MCKMQECVRCKSVCKMQECVRCKSSSCTTKHAIEINTINYAHTSNIIQLSRRKQIHIHYVFSNSKLPSIFIYYSMHKRIVIWSLLILTRTLTIDLYIYPHLFRCIVIYLVRLTYFQHRVDRWITWQHRPALL